MRLFPIWFFRLEALEKKVEILGEKMVPLQTGFTDLTNAVNALGTEVVSVESAIASLQAQVAAGSPITGDQLEALATQVAGINTGLASAIAPAGTSTSTATSS